ncbi:MAG TPA: hypothetical protein VJ777_01280, partial [Mycobacterium sp.]|nr:hypothetical protein [Mycobacterium sp.]
MANPDPPTLAPLRTDPATATAGNSAPRWLLPPPPTAQAAALTVIGIPHAGAGPGSYRVFGRHLAPEIALRLVHLPGRESRLNEP